MNIFQKLALLLFVIIELVGFVGILNPGTHEYFVSLTPVNLVFLLFVLMVFHQRFFAKEVWWMLLVLLVGYGVEVVGVATGVIFGEYAYGVNLGPVILGAPPVMGVNWLLLCYSSVRLVNIDGLSNGLKALMSAGLMVSLDIVMEPVAMAFDFWQWHNDAIPVQNYFAWGLVAFLLNLSWYSLKNKSLNNFSPWLFGYLAVFFLTMRIWMT